MKKQREFHKNLKMLRERKGNSVAEMAKNLGISVSTYREWEYGRKILGEPYLEIAIILDVGLNELFENQNNEYLEVREAIKAVKKSLKELEEVCESFF